MGKIYDTAEPVKLRQKELNNGRMSLYLDIHDGKKRIKEYLKLYIIPAKNTADREYNRRVMATAEAKRVQRLNELREGLLDYGPRYQLDMPFLDYYKKMVKERAANRDSTGNYGNWKSCLHYLEVYCKEGMTFRDVTPEWIQGFKDYLEHVEKGTYKTTRNSKSEFFRPLSQNSKVSYFNKLRACINQAFNDHIIPYNPVTTIKGFKQEETEREYLTWDEVVKLSETPCKYPFLKNAFLFSCLTGLRKCDILKLTWGEIHKFGEFTRIIFKQKKTGGQEYLDIPESAVQYMGERGEPDDLIFDGFKYSSETSLELRRWCLEAGMHKDITFHCGRHTFAVLLLETGSDIYTVSKLLGHRELQTTQIYAHMIDKNKQAAVMRIPKLGKAAQEVNEDK